MTTMVEEFGNIKERVTECKVLLRKCDSKASPDYLATRYDDEPTVVVRCTAMDKEDSSPEQSECEPRLIDSSQQQETRKVDVETKESLADWGVVVCVFLSNFIAAIYLSGFAVFYEELRLYFWASKSDVDWCYSINGVFHGVAALFATYPIKSYGCRWPSVVGCLLLFLGLLLSVFATDLTTLYLTYGVIAGSGSGVAVLSTNIIVFQRFSRNRNRAFGIGLLGFICGDTIGVFVTYLLMHRYRLQGAFLILAAIQVQRIPLCLFFHTPKRLTSQSNHASETSSQRISGQVILNYLKETFNFSILRHARYSVYSIAYFLHIFCLYSVYSVAKFLTLYAYYYSHVRVPRIDKIMAVVTQVSVCFIANHPKVKSSLVFAIGMLFAFFSIVAIVIDSGFVGSVTSSGLFGLYLGCTTAVFAVVAVDLMGVTLLPRSLAILQVIEGVAGLLATLLVRVTWKYMKAIDIINGIICCMAFVSSGLMFALPFVKTCQRKSIAKDIELPLSDKTPPDPPTRQ